ncbi:hypothetical protein AVEN_118616-1 [Araneus ventricosus]|uniref:Uncharacterized protein n=1 Tax=Araneus ventricosus TaxID=182803 RepID=A0A4Y2AWW0_ARAVE|nr:hypothetical protein AVEN_118616-1 [Araneus ventricosus]
MKEVELNISVELLHTVVQTEYYLEGPFKRIGEASHHSSRAKTQLLQIRSNILFQERNDKKDSLTLIQYSHEAELGISMSNRCRHKGTHSATKDHSGFRI